MLFITRDKLYIFNNKEEQIFVNINLNSLNRYINNIQFIKTINNTLIRRNLPQIFIKAINVYLIKFIKIINAYKDIKIIKETLIFHY